MRTRENKNGFSLLEMRMTFFDGEEEEGSARRRKEAFIRGKMLEPLGCFGKYW